MSFIWLMLLFSAHVAESLPEKPKRSALNQLTRTLLRTYDCGVRPVHNWTHPTTVYIDLSLQSILNVDGQRQSITTSIWYRQIWTDEFLVWDPKDFDGIDEISLSSVAIWIPDIIVSEFVDEGTSPLIPYVYVNASGSVKNYKPMQVVMACSLEMFAFPFDKQNCSLTFRSWLHSVQEIDLALWRNPDAVTNDKREFMNDGEWELLSIPTQYWLIRQDNTDFAHIQFNILIRRRPLLYVVGLLIPSIFLMLVDVVSFSLPLNSRSRIAFKISILLGYTVFRVNMTNELPATAVSTPLIGVFFAVCMALLMLSLIKSILVVKLLHHSEKEVRQMSMSACLLNKYGLGGHSLRGNGGTLDPLQQSGDVVPNYEPASSLEENPLYPNQFQDAASELERILWELVSLRVAFSQEDGESSAQADWLRLCSRLDCFLFRLYLFIMGLYAAVLLILWSVWSFA